MKMKLKRKELLGVLLGLALALGLVPGIAMTALADPSDGDLNIVEIGNGNSTTCRVPYNSLWGYSCVEQIYTADEIGEAGVIHTIAFNMKEGSQTCDFDVWLVPVAQDTFVQATDFVNMDLEACNYAGQITFSTGWTTITLQEPFVYDGTSNVLVCFHEKTPGYSTVYFYMHNAQDKVLSFHSDSNDPNPTDLGPYGGNTYTHAERCNIRFGISPLHTHDLTYAADGATVTATCSNADGKCALDDGTELHGHASALTIVAPTLTTYGQTGEGVSESATLDGADAFNAATGLGVSADSIRYYAATRDGDAYVKVGDGDALAAAPTGAGDYVAEIALAGVKTGPEATGDVAASVGYTIAKAATAVTEIPMAGGITYGQTLADSALAGGAGSVEGAFAWADDTIAPEVADSDSTEYDVVFTPSDSNYAAATCRVTLTVDRAGSAVAEAPAAKAPAYTGSAQELVSAGKATGGEMRYALGTEAGATGPYAASVPAATEVGAYHVWYKVAGDDNHEDSEPACVAASIGRADLSGAEVELTKSSYAYDGKAKEPKVRSAVLNGRKLKAGKDFSVSYKGNTKVGTATVTITGTGNYEGTAEATFSIVPARVAGLTTAGHPAKGTLDVAWKAAAGAKGYQLSWRKAGGSWKSKTVKATGAAIEGLKAGGLYEVRVRARAGSATGAWSKVACRWLKKASSIKAAAGKAKGTVRVSWAADAQATGGYVAYACAKKDGAIVAKAAVAAGRTSATLRGLESGKAYYVKVRPLREASGTIYVGVQRYCKATVKAK